jgi:hypothetical protein
MAGKRRAKRGEGEEFDRKRDLNWYYKAVDEYLNGEQWPPLSARAFQVWTAMWAKAIPRLGIVHVSHEQLRKMSRARSKGTVQTALRELMAKGYVLRIVPREYKPQDPWTFRMLLQPEAQWTEIEDLLVEFLTQPPEEEGKP